MSKAVIKEAYENFTPESVAEGDADDRGWIDEGGSEYSFREAVKLLQGTEPSASHYHAGIWYTNYGEADCHSGDTENRSYHVTASEGFQRRLFKTLTQERF